MQKNSKNHENRKKIFFPRNNLKYLSLRQQHHLRCFGQVSGQDLSKNELGQFSQKSLTPDMQKKIQKIMKIEKKCFHQKNLKYLR